MSSQWPLNEECMDWSLAVDNGLSTCGIMGAVGGREGGSVHEWVCNVVSNIAKSF